MLKTGAIAAILCLAMALGGPASARKEPDLPLARDGKWVLDYADGACTLTGVFGIGPARVVARFSQVGPGQSLTLVLIGKRLESDQGAFGGARVTFLPTTGKTPWREVAFGEASIDDGALPATFVGRVRMDNGTYLGSDYAPPAPVTPETERAVTALEYEQRGGGRFTLDLQSMGPPMIAMRQCIDNLVRYWGFDPAELATRQSRVEPRGSPANWILDHDYPEKMGNAGASAFVTFRLNVDETGTVTGCSVLEATKPPEAGPRTCELIVKRARFTPSRDKDGKPVKDYYINRVFWRATG